ncbi:hypothetical protein M9H77_27556 [Catharanthus roseus]|uniref:Uncharacterized protein n=1 Tax=Catharanthus roseus TaxID=4058 RepID=A0ACC0AH60_CATRO|nr:hypothetical protein M9H77_27556 [Catharanthus roseus]
MDSKMRSLTDLLHQINTGPISNVREMRHLAKGVLNPVLPEDLGSLKGGRRVRDKSHWEHVSIAHRKIQKSSGFVSSSDTGSGSLPGSGFGSRSRGREIPPRSPREKGRGRDCGRTTVE